MEEAREKSAAWVEEACIMDASLAEDAAEDEARHAEEKRELAAQVDLPLSLITYPCMAWRLW